MKEQPVILGSLSAAMDSGFITPNIVGGEPEGAELRALLHRELDSDGTSLDAITGDLQADAAAQLRTRIRSLLADVAGAAEASA